MKSQPVMQLRQRSKDKVKTMQSSSCV